MKNPGILALFTSAQRHDLLGLPEGVDLEKYIPSLTVEIGRVGTKPYIQVVSPTGVDAGVEPEGLTERIIGGFKPDQKLKIVYTRRGGPVSAEWEGVVYTNFSGIPYFNMINGAIYRLMTALVGELERFFNQLPSPEDLKAMLENAATRNLEQGFLRKELACIVGIRSIRVLTFEDLVQASICTSAIETDEETSFLMTFVPEDAARELGLNSLHIAIIPFVTRSRFSSLGATIIQAAAETMLAEVNFRSREAFACRALLWERAIASELYPKRTTTPTEAAPEAAETSEGEGDTEPPVADEEVPAEPAPADVDDATEVPEVVGVISEPEPQAEPTDAAPVAAINEAPEAAE